MKNDIVRWGVGDKRDAKAFDTTTVDGRTVDLIFGEYPHQRCDNNMYARYPDGSIDDFDGHRILVGVTIESENYLKESELSGNEIRKGGTGKIFFDGVQVYEFFFRDSVRACYVAARYVDIIREHPLHYWDPKEKVVGRKVWYYDDPAVVTMLLKDQGCVVLEPDGIDRFKPKPWRGEDADDGYETSVKIDIVQDQSVWWWREPDRKWLE